MASWSGEEETVVSERGVAWTGQYIPYILSVQTLNSSLSVSHIWSAAILKFYFQIAPPISIPHEWIVAFISRFLFVRIKLNQARTGNLHVLAVLPVQCALLNQTHHFWWERCEFLIWPWDFNLFTNRSRGFQFFMSSAALLLLLC